MWKRKTGGSDEKKGGKDDKRKGMVSTEDIELNDGDQIDSRIDLRGDAQLGLMEIEMPSILIDRLELSLLLTTRRKGKTMED